MSSSFVSITPRKSSVEIETRIPSSSFWRRCMSHVLNCDLSSLQTSHWTKWQTWLTQLINTCLSWQKRSLLRSSLRHSIRLASKVQRKKTSTKWYWRMRSIPSRSSSSIPHLRSTKVTWLTSSTRRCLQNSNQTSLQRKPCATMPCSRSCPETQLRSSSWQVSLLIQLSNVTLSQISMWALSRSGVIISKNRKMMKLLRNPKKKSMQCRAWQRITSLFNSR